MSAATNLPGPWYAPTAKRRPFADLSPPEKYLVLAFAVRDLRRYGSELTSTQRTELALCLPLEGRGVESLTDFQRGRLAAVGLPLLRRIAGWAP